MLAGGVAANTGLREGLKEAVAEELEGVQLVIPPLSLTGDNAAMIGAAAFLDRKDPQSIDLALNAQPGLML